MIEPIPHKRESDRMAELYSVCILDTFAEEDYDDLTTLAAEICNSPVSLITFVDENRQWFKSRVGLNVTETPRSVSFCGHTINEENDCLIVENALVDERFSDNPIVRDEPRVIFYAGIKLMMNNLPLGTICVIDHKPNSLTDTQLACLKALGRQVERLLELRLSKKELEASLEEKDLLYSELKHRTKNNLQLITSLIGIKARKSIDSDRLNDIIKMIIAMSRVYEISYSGEEKGSLRVDHYIKDVANLFEVDSEITFKLKLDAGDLSEREALYVGLILNEAITNSKKHADSDDLIIQIVFKNREDGKSLIITDNGPGFPEDINNDDSYPHGIALIQSMAKQIDGEISFRSEGGAVIHLKFK